MSASNRGGKSGRDKTTKAHSLQNGKTDTSVTGVKHQPTAEQLRLAQITSDKSDIEPDIAKKVKQVCELTGRTQDEALAVLHDCDYDTNQAVEILIEKQGEVNDWQEISKKKKTPVGNKASQPNVSGSGESSTDIVADRNDVINESERIQERPFESAPRGRREQRGAPRFNRGRGGSNANGEKGGSASRERPSYEQGGGRGGRRRGGGGGGRGGYGRGFYGGRNNFDGGSPHIDTWSNEKTVNGTADAGAVHTEADWSTEDWAADEWSGSLEESRVFTASGSTVGHSTSVFGTDSSSSAVVTSSTSSYFESSSQAFATSSASSSSIRTPGGGTTTGTDGVSPALLGEATIYRTNTLQSTNINQDASFELNRLLQQSKLGDQYQQAKLPAETFNPQEQSAAYLSRYAQEATEAIKNVVGIGSSAMAGRSVGMDPMGHNMSTSQSVLQNCVPASVTKQPPQQQQQQRPKLAPPSKIPSSAVEMPASMNSAQLDVQFGNWDIPTAASAEVASLSFTADISASTPYGNNQHSISQVSEPGLTAIYEMSAARSSNAESSKASLLNLDDLGLASASKQAGQTVAPAGSYQNNAAVQKDYVNSKVVNNQQPYSSSQSGERKPTSYAPSQSGQQSNQTGALASQLPFSQVSASYSGGMESGAISSIYKSSATVTSASPTPAFSSQQHTGNQYGSASSFSSYPSSASDTGSASGLAAAVAAAQQQFSYTGSAAPGFGPQPAMVGSGSGGTGYGPSQNQAAAASYAGGTGLHGAGNKSFNVTQPAATAATYSGGNISSQGYDAANSYQFGGGQLPNAGGGSGYGQYQNSGQLSYQGVAYNQSTVNPGYDSNSSGAAYGNAAHSYSTNMYQRTSTAAPDSTAAAAAAGYQRSMNGTGVAQQAATTSTTAQSASATSAGKLTDGLSKLSVKDSPGVAASASTGVPVSGQFDATNVSSSLSTTTGTTSSVSGGTPSTTATSRATSAAPASTKSSAPATSKPVASMPVGGPAVVNNYAMIAQPPGFPLATFGYPTAQQPVQYTYEDLQLLQSGQRFPVPYYDMQASFQPATTMTGRENSATINAQSYAPGAESTKLAPIDPMSPVAVQSTPAAAQQATVPGSAAAVAVQQQQQQSYLNPAAMHPGYGYYYPGTAGIMSVGSYYMPMIQTGGLAVPINPAHGVTTATTQYQKAAATAMYGSHAGYSVGGQTQDFSKSFGATQSASKGPAVAAGAAAAASSDALAGGNAFSKNHVQTFDKSGFHSGTPPPPFNMAAAQTGAALGGGYGTPYMQTMIPHQSHSTQILHHQMSQDAGRGAVPQSQSQQPKSGSLNKASGYGTGYWGSN